MYWKDILKRQYQKIHKVRQRLNKLQPKHELDLAGEHVLFTDSYLEDDIVSIKQPKMHCPLTLPVSGYSSSWFNHSNANSACVSNRRHQTHDEYACVLGMTLALLSPWKQMFCASTDVYVNVSLLLMPGMYSNIWVLLERRIAFVHTKQSSSCPLYK